MKGISSSSRIETNVDEAVSAQAITRRHDDDRFGFDVGGRSQTETKVVKYKGIIIRRFDEDEDEGKGNNDSRKGSAADR